MGFFKKIFKPVSRVLDKIIPNEIKPALPYLAAFAPYMAPSLFGSAAGGLGSFLKIGARGGGALLGGGLNSLAQLAQEGNEGDINLMSAGLGALSGAMAVPGAESSFAGERIVGKGVDGNITAADYAKLSEGTGLGTGVVPTEGIAGAIDPGFATESIAQIQGPIPFNQVVPGGSSDLSIFTKAKNLGLGTLEKGSGLIKSGQNTLGSSSASLLDKAKVLSLPTAQATGDVMFAEAKRAQDAYADELAAYEAEMGDGATDAGRALAIRRAMEAYGFVEDEIADAISAAGYRDGGRVGYKLGDFVKGSGIFQPVSASMNAGDRPMMSGSGMGGMLSNMINNNPQLFSNLNRSNNDIDFIDENQNGIDDRQEKATGGRVGLRFGGIGEAVEAIENRDMKEAMKFAMQDMDIPITQVVEEFEIKFKRKPNSLDELKEFYKDKYTAPGETTMKETVKETIMAKDGGLMNLGGKEMDMRGGGFIPIGKKERADDVPARLSKNEFVMTADAVRAAGGGSVNEGAKRMYETMNRLEAKV